MNSSSIHPAILKARQEQQQKASKMSITHTFFLAHKARGKLSTEASKPSHDLRLLVLHANFLDQLMLNLSQAEQEQDAWFNNIVRGHSEDDENEYHSSFDSIPEEDAEVGWHAGDYSSDSDSETSDEEEDNDDEDALEIRSDFTLFPASLSEKPSAYNERNIQATAVEIDSDYDSEEEELDENEDGDGFYALERTTSHRPPSLVDDLSDSDEEYSNPPSPPQPTLAVPIISEQQRKQLATTSYFEERADGLMESDLYAPQSSNLIAAF